MNQDKDVLLVACVNSVTLLTAETTLSTFTFTRKLLAHESFVHQTRPRMIYSCDKRNRRILIWMSKGSPHLESPHWNFGCCAP
jgi:hypothetical protein